MARQPFQMPGRLLIALPERSGGSGRAVLARGLAVSVNAVVMDRGRRSRGDAVLGSPAAWIRLYVRWAAVADGGCALAGGALAMELRFGRSSPGLYLVFTAVLPLLWWATLAIAGGYESRFI